MVTIIIIIMKYLVLYIDHVDSKNIFKLEPGVGKYTLSKSF